ncbi:MAG: Sec-independent protein translocase protein TatB [Acidimicrobiales bacterium]
MSTGGMLGILDSLTGGEVLIILVVALLVLGPERLPETARTMGQWMSKLRSMTSNLQSEVREVLDDPAMKPIREVGEFVAAPRKKLMEFATAAEAEAEAAKKVAEDAARAAEEAEAAAAAARAAADDMVTEEIADLTPEEVAEEAAPETAEDVPVAEPAEIVPDETGVPAPEGAVDTP